MGSIFIHFVIVLVALFIGIFLETLLRSEKNKEMKEIAKKIIRYTSKKVL